MNVNKKLIAICSGAAALVAAIILILVFALRTKSNAITVGFYSVNDSEKSAVEECLNILNDGQEKPYKINYIEYDSSLALAEQISLSGRHSPDFVFMTSGLEADNLIQSFPKKIKAKSFFDSSSISAYTSSLRGKSKRNEAGDGLVQLPLLSDFMEIDIDRSVLSATGTEIIANWDDIERFARRSRQFISPVIVFAGRDDATLINTVGALTESLASSRQLNEATRTLLALDANAKNLEQLYYDAISSLSNDPSAPLYAAMQALGRWICVDQTMPNDALNLTLTDVFNYMDFKTAAVVLMTLSEHRNAPYDDISRYSSIYYPSEAAPEMRVFASRTVIAVPLTTQKNKLNFVQNLSSSEIQKTLARSSGLAPADASCQPADKQADETRYWIAATNTPAVPLADAVCPSPKAKAALASAIRSYVKGLDF